MTDAPDPQGLAEGGHASGDPVSDPPRGTATASNATEGSPSPGDGEKSRRADGTPPEGRDDLDELISHYAHNMVSDGVRASNVWQGNTIYVDNVVLAGRARELRLRADTTAHTEAEAATFVEPSGYTQLVDALSTEAIALVVGQARTGRRAAALQALRQSGCERLVQLAADGDARQLLAEVNREASTSIGYLVESVDPPMLQSLASFGVHELRAHVRPAKCAVVLVSDSTQVAAAPRLDEIPLVELGVPEPRSVLRRRLELMGRSDDMDALVAVIELLHEPPAPRQIIDMISTIDCSSSTDPTKAAATYSSAASFSALDAWLGSGRPAQDIAMVAAAATLHELPVGDVYLGAERLAELVDPDADDGKRDGPRMITRVSQQWPSELIALSNRTVPTHFGLQGRQSISFNGPHRAEWTLEFLWDRLGPSFRNPFVTWLVDLATEQDLVEPAAITAGVLLGADPVTMESHVLRRWAKSPDVRHNLAAAYALGVPVVIGGDASGVRRLAKSWESCPRP